VTREGFDRRERAAEAARVLNSFILDFVVGTRALEIFEHPQIRPIVSQSIAIGLDRMSHSHLVMALAKWAEFYQQYKAILPSDVRPACKSLHDEINGRGIRDFRNTVVGHLIDNATGRPLSSEEINTRFNRTLGNDPEQFKRWINNPNDNSFPNSVVAITQRVRDRLRSEYMLSDDETR